MVRRRAVETGRRAGSELRLRATVRLSDLSSELVLSQNDYIKTFVHWPKGDINSSVGGYAAGLNLTLVLLLPSRHLVRLQDWYWLPTTPARRRPRLGASRISALWVTPGTSKTDAVKEPIATYLASRYVKSDFREKIAPPSERARGHGYQNKSVRCSGDKRLVAEESISRWA